jgi:hypothetical protein
MMLTLTPTKMPLYIPQVGDMVEITTRCKHTGEVGTVTRIGKKISVSFFERGKAAYWASSLRCSRRGLGYQLDYDVNEVCPRKLHAGRPGKGEYITGYCPGCGGYAAFTAFAEAEDKNDVDPPPKLLTHIHKDNFPPLIQHEDGWEIDFSRRWPDVLKSQRGVMYRHYKTEHTISHYLPLALRPIRKRRPVKANGKTDWALAKRKYLARKRAKAEEERLE